MNCLGRAALCAALITFAAGSANAQITTVVATPPKRDQVSQQVAARREQAAQDSVARVTMTDMKEWVDSAAAALAIRPDTALAVADTAVAAPSAPAPHRSTPARADTTTEFRDAARAPNTATAAPTIVVLGVALILLGAIVRKRPRAATSRIRR